MLPPLPGAKTLEDSQFFDTEEYISEIKDTALAKESTIFCTVHCPENRYLLASSNQGRLAIWDLSHYLFPSKAATSWTETGANDGPARSKNGLRKFYRALQISEVRAYPCHLLRKGYPRLSLQVSDRAINSIIFAGEASNPLLVLAGDEAIFIWPWAQVLALLNQSPPSIEANILDLGPPISRLQAFPSQRTWPFLTESNQVTTERANNGGCNGGSKVLFSACGDAAVRVWDLEKQVCTSTLVGHSSYVHAVRAFGGSAAGAGGVISGAEAGRIGIWDIRASNPLIKLVDAWQGNRTGKVDQGDNSLNTSRWVAALDVDRGGNFLVAGGGIEWAGSSRVSKFGFISIFHIPSFSLVSQSATPSSSSSSSTSAFVQDVRFGEDKVISAGNESVITHWNRPMAEASARVQVGIPSIFSINTRDGPGADGVTVYAGEADYVQVFIYQESSAFNLKFR